MAAGIRKVVDQLASSTNLSATKQGLDVSIVDGSGNQITTFGGGVQYTEGDTDSTISGTSIFWEDTADTLRAVSAAKPLPVSLGASNVSLISERVSNTDGASTAFTNFSAVASTKNFVKAITVFRTDTDTAMAYVDIRDGTGGAILWTMPLPPLGGSTVSSAVPLFKNATANTALAFDVSSALTTVFISMSGFQSTVY